MISVKEKLVDNKTVIGTFSKFSSPVSSEILGYLGFDFLILDMEHSALDFHQAENLIRAGDAAGISTIIRVPGVEESPILRVLEAGSQGIQAPGVDTADMAKKVVEASRYRPIGRRGLSFSTRAAQYTIKDKNQHIIDSIEKQLVTVQIESKEAVENVEKIAAVEGIDVLFLGPGDLSNSLGVPGQLNHPLVQEAMIRLCKAAEENGKVAGTFVGNQEQALRAFEAGVRYLVFDNDVAFFAKGAQSVLEELKKSL
ncbi:4-hydroxy-2-oxoheptanedioate aldolase [Neobacillus niacini]|uniref:HpcH/HpaI aldolase family protein n=1 Tax=Neobacillus niacini TaxID=86668 RepID=UPI002858CA01|nr:aldolase/citrate lyase family protein [Neobacillus niacini]MDR7077333.1 4-hydroxy-2-oxoheptanedioate aldolase [Neobacillus niacini]